MTTRKIYDYIVIGGGIVGVATARELVSRHPNASIVLVEKEEQVACHQTGRNSGVIHAGVYYKPGSLKARFCREGNVATKAFCDAENIPYETCGKLLVATDAQELARMQDLIQRCQDNELEYEVLDQAQLREREPNIEGVGAIFVPSSGIVNYAAITQRMLEQVKEAGVKVLLGAEVTALEEFADRITVFTTKKRLQSRFIVSCAGLHSDRMVSMLGKTPEFKILPFRGEYFLLSSQHNKIVNHLIYPIPDPSLPFLGVHLTKMIDGTVTVGPNAVLSFKREGYSRLAFSWKDTFDALSYPGFFKVLLKHPKATLSELKDSLWTKGYLARVQKYAPQLKLEDLNAYPPGVRAQAITADGKVVDDFLFESTHRALVVCNAPSPAATSAMPIATYIVDRLDAQVAKVY